MQKPLSFIALAVALASALYAAPSGAAVWGWVGPRGIKVYSDTPPPPDVPAKSVFLRPSGASALAAATPNGTAPAGDAAIQPSATRPAPPASPPAGDPALIKKMAAAQEAASAAKRVQSDQEQAARAENCRRARQSLNTLQSGIRMATTNANGEREFMSDEARAAETQRAQTLVAANCS